VGQTARQAARQEHELRRRALAERVEVFEDRLREQLDWRARLRRNRGRLMVAAAGAALLLTAVIVLRLRLTRRDTVHTPATLDDIARELHEISKQLERQGAEPSLLRRLVLRGAVAAASAGGAYAARQMVQRDGGDRKAGAAASAR
jgi:hypothetical protein